MIHTFEISKKISSKTANEIRKRMKFKSFSRKKSGDVFYVSTDLMDQGINRVKIQKRKMDNIPGYEDYIFLVINPSVMLPVANTMIAKEDRRNYPTGTNIFSDLFVFSLYNYIYSFIPELNAYRGLKSWREIANISDLVERERLYKEWEKVNFRSFKLRRIDFTYDIDRCPQEYLALLNRGYKIKFGENTKYGHEYGEQNIDAKSKSIELKVYDKERELMERMMVSEEIASNHPVLRIELSLTKNKMNYIRRKKNKSVERTLFDFADADIGFEETFKYVKRMVGEGSYVEYDTAIQIIDNSNYSDNIKSKLKAHILGISKHRGIEPYLKSFKNSNNPTEGTVRKHLKMIHDLGINPVTISKKGFENIPVVGGHRGLPSLLDYLRLYYKIESEKDFDKDGTPNPEYEKKWIPIFEKNG